METNKTELIKNLRVATSAGMADCKSALEETNYDLQAAVDLLKVRGLNNASRNSSKVAAEGIVNFVMGKGGKEVTAVECNSITDFVSQSKEFKEFAGYAALALANTDLYTFDGDISKLSYCDKNIEQLRTELMASTKENIVVRRWFRLDVTSDNHTVVYYEHSNRKLGAMASFETSDPSVFGNRDFKDFAESVVMQIAAMNPLAVSKEQLPQDEVNRQKAIFETQLKEMGKPESAWPKILNGKFNKWCQEVCLLDQESVVHPKKTVGEVMKEISTKLNANIHVMSFVRIQVGEGLEAQKTNLADEVAKLTGVE